MFLLESDGILIQIADQVSVNTSTITFGTVVTTRRIKELFCAFTLSNTKALVLGMLLFFNQRCTRHHCK